MFFVANNEKGFHCGGTLINERYVLTGMLGVATRLEQISSFLFQLLIASRKSPKTGNLPVSGWANGRSRLILTVTKTAFVRHQHLTTTSSRRSCIRSTALSQEISSSTSPCCDWLNESSSMTSCSQFVCQWIQA
jgi:hypothetical protein